MDLAGCCAACVKDSLGCREGEAACSTFTCPTGYKPLSFMGNGCCIMCEADETFCKSEKDAFEAWRKNRLAVPAALACTVTEDCEVAVLGNACGGDCGTVVAKAESAKLKSDVLQYGQTNCGHCPIAQVACGLGGPPPACVDGKCRL